MQSNGWCGKIRVSQTTNYTYDHSGRLVHERTIREFTNGGATNKSITYLYDCNTIVGMILNGVKYFFQRNIQGDVVGVYDSTGTKVVGFRYDAFGRCTVIGDVNLAQWCKIRYRGYYYDTETGFYWVQTRYYNPDWCRWISPDEVEFLNYKKALGINLYLYCFNDPVNFSGPSGCEAITLTATTALALCVVFIAGVSLLYLGTQIHAISNAVSGVINSIGYVVSDIFDRAKDLMTSYVESLTPKNQYDKDQKHHIVAKKDSRAELARIILKKAGIEIDDPRTTVYINNSYHRVMHTNTYHFIVDITMSGAYFFGGDEGVETLLKIYRAILGELK